mgnify:CR=1 FL=1
MDKSGGEKPIDHYKYIVQSMLVPRPFRPILAKILDACGWKNDALTFHVKAGMIRSTWDFIQVY